MIWLIGNKGMLGTELGEMFQSRNLSYCGTDREVDITNLDSLRAFAAGKQIDCIVNCAAYTAVDKAEDDTVLCTRLNTDGARNIATVASELGASLVHLSTDYVFNGNGTRPYLEDDPVDPTGVYGKTKLEGERAVLKENPRTWVLRTAWLYGEHGNNFVHTMLKLMAERETLAVVNDQRGSPTWAFDLSATIADFIGSALAGSPHPYGVYHFTNEGDCTWFDFACEIYRVGREVGILDLSKEVVIRPCTSEEFPAKVRRPPYSVLDKSKITHVLCKNIPTWKASLKKYLDGYAARFKE